jgi:PAS domain S-box-containing protein
MFSLDLEGRVIICNTAAERIFGWSRSEIAGQILPLVPEDRLEEFHRLKDRLIAGQTISGVELTRQKKDGSSIEVSLWSAPIYNDNNACIGLISFYEDIGERKAIAKRLEQNLEEKQILLREIHHRVKNNLSVISSLLNLQSATITNPEQAIEAFRNSRDRIMAMALVHMELYESGDFARIDMGTYLGNLTRQIALVNENAGQVSLVSHAENLMLDLQVAVPCGLILNELITNAYKYASRDGMKAGIDVVMARTGDGQFTISVSDNGPGLPAGYENTGSLGFTLVKLLVDQIDGTMDIDSSGDGTTIRIRFPDPALV